MVAILLARAAWRVTRTSRVESFKALCRHCTFPAAGRGRNFRTLSLSGKKTLRYSIKRESYCKRSLWALIFYELRIPC